MQTFKLIAKWLASVTLLLLAMFAFVNLLAALLTQTGIALSALALISYGILHWTTKGK